MEESNSVETTDSETAVNKHMSFISCMHSSVHVLMSCVIALHWRHTTAMFVSFCMASTAVYLAQ
jgi:hypothetical protein